MITFILNNELVSTCKPSGSSLLDFIRYEAGLTGTKIGCREGDCGACTVMLGTAVNGKMIYKSVVSCLTPLCNAHGKHVVTIEGINIGKLTHVQQAFVTNAATQCGFCTPGFVMSLTAESLSGMKTTKESSINAVSGNICRCTGYKSIERAAEEIAVALLEKDVTDPVGWLVKHKHLPEYFLSIPERLNGILKKTDTATGNTYIAGGTDLMVQKADDLAENEIESFYDRPDLKGISIEKGVLRIGAATTMSEINASEEIRKLIPDIASYLKLIASEPVRNMATVAGNIANASPIGDFTIILLALNAEAEIDGHNGKHNISLHNFYEGYKKLKLSKGEFLRGITVTRQPALFSFEKVSKRKHLDIASVNSAIGMSIEKNIITACSLSAGGVSPVPLYLKKTSDFIKGKSVSPATILQAAEVMQSEISPISDVRGSADYKRLLLRQLFFAHFIKLFPDKMNLKDLL